MEIAGPLVDLGADAAKAMPPHTRHRYYQQVRLTLSDGSAHLTRVKAMTKPKLAAALASEHRNVALKRWFVVLTDDRTHIALHSVKYRI